MIIKQSGQAALLMGVAIGMQLEESQHKKDAWARAAESYRRLAKQAEELAGECILRT